MKRWYAVYTKPRQEQVARENLARQGYEVYLPRIGQARRRRGRRVAVVAALFPRYLFVHLDLETDNCAPIRSTLGVTSLVRFGQAPTPAPEGLIALLRGREDAAGLQPPPASPLKPGARVRVAEGSLMGYEGILVARTGAERVRVLLTVMGQPARVSLDAGAVEPAEGGE